MNARFRGLASPCLACILAGCVRTSPAPDIGYWVSSDSSQYSPVVRFHVSSAARRDQLRIVLDSGVLFVPGRFTTESPVVLTNLYVTVYLAATNRGPMALATADSVRFADRRGWRATASSDSLLLADYLRFGERRALGGIEFRLPSSGADDPESWLVFRLSAKVVDRWLPFDPHGALTVGRPGGDVHVYACSDRNLAGRVDSARANGLRRSYGAMC